MGDKELYTLDIAEDDLTDSQDQIQRNASKQGVLQTGPAAVESVSLEPGDLLLTGEFRGAADEMERIMAAEVEDLFDASAIEAVAYRDVSEASEEDGYYTLENVNVFGADPRASGSSTFDGKLVLVGTRKSQFRTIRTTTSTVTNDFDDGAGGTPLIAVPARARYVRWFERASKATEPASPVDSRVGEFGDVDLFDLADASFSGDVGLCYDLPHAADGLVDTRVWDDRGRSKATAPYSTTGATLSGATVGSSTLTGFGTKIENRWRRVFRTGHQFVGRAVVENGHLRLIFDEIGGKLHAARWDGDTYTHVQLGDSPWRLFDLDLQRVGDDRVKAQVAFRDQTTCDIETLQLSLQRGQTDALWTRPSGDPATPAGLETRLDPIAAPWTTDPSPDKGLLARTEVE